MRSWLPAAAAGMLLGLVAVGVVTALRDGSEASVAERADALAAELRCPDCQGLSVADSPTQSADEIRRQIGELLAGGASDEEVRDHFVARYGEWIRLAPSSTAVWVIPFVVVGLAGCGLVAWLISRRTPAPPGDPAVSAAERRRLHDEAEALDA